MPIFFGVKQVHLKHVHRTPIELPEHVHDGFQQGNLPHNDQGDIPLHKCEDNGMQAGKKTAGNFNEHKNKGQTGNCTGKGCTLVHVDNNKVTTRTTSCALKFTRLTGTLGLILTLGTLLNRPVRLTDGQTKFWVSNRPEQ